MFLASALHDMGLKRTWQLIRETFSEWSEDKVPSLSAALAYYTAFSIAPILVIAIAIVGLVFGREAAQGQITQQISSLIGETAAQGINEMTASAQKQGTGIAATVIGFALLLFGATGLFAELHNSLNTIWEVEPKPGAGIWQTIRERFLSFTMVLGVGFLLLVSLVLSAGLAALGSFITNLFPGAQVITYVLSFVISFEIITLLFAMMFKLLPDAKISWRDVWVGAATTALLFVMGKFLIGLYLGTSDAASGFGAAGALVILLLWVYYSAQILFLGAEFTQVYSRHFGSRIVPSENAVPLSEESALSQKSGLAAEKAERKPFKPEPVPWEPLLWQCWLTAHLAVSMAVSMPVAANKRASCWSPASNRPSLLADNNHVKLGFIIALNRACAGFRLFT